MTSISLRSRVPPVAAGRLDSSRLDRAFSALLGPGIDFGDLYFQHSRRESWSMEDGIVKDGAHSIEQGVGVRAISGEKTGFAYSDDIQTEALLGAARSARAISREGTARDAQALVRADGRALYPAEDPIDSMDNETKVAMLRRLDQLLRAADPRVRQVMISLAGGIDTVLVARSDGVLGCRYPPVGADQRAGDRGTRRPPRIRLCRRRRALFLCRTVRRWPPERFAREALRQALCQSGRSGRAGRHDAGGAGAGLARSIAARGGGARPGRRFQSQGHQHLCRAHGPAGVAAPG